MIAHNPHFFSKAIHAIEKFHRALPKSLRIRIQRWVEKLVSSGGNLAYVRHRDAYTKLMLNMILKRKLEEPFHKMPPDGQLPPFPTHMKVLLKPPFGQEENEFWHQVISRVHEEASAHKDISTDTAVHGSRIANNSSIHGIARSPYQGLAEESTAAMKSAAKGINEDASLGVIGRDGVGAGVAGVLDVETPMRQTPGKRVNHHVAFSEAKGMSNTGGGDRYTPSKYGFTNHSSFVGGDAPERRRTPSSQIRGHGATADESKQDVSTHSEDKTGTSFWRQDQTSLDLGRKQSVNSEYSRVLSQVKARNPALPEAASALKTLVREQQVRIAILEDQLRTMGTQYEQYIDKIEVEHAQEVGRLKVVAGNGRPSGAGAVPGGTKASPSVSETGKQLFPRQMDESTVLADHGLPPHAPSHQQGGAADASFRSSIDFAREYPSVDFDNGVGQGITTGIIGDPDTSMVGAGYPMLSRSSPSKVAGRERGYNHIHISSPPGKLSAKLPQSPIESLNQSMAKFDIRSRPPPPPFPTSLVLKEAAESPSKLAATVQTQRWVNLSREGL